MKNERIQQTYATSIPASPNCLRYCTTGLLYCTCGACLYLAEKTRQMNRDRFDALSIPLYVMKKGPLHVARCGNTEGQRIYHAAHIAAKTGKAKRVLSPSWSDFKHVRFAGSHSSRLDGTKPSAHTMTNFQMQITHTCATQKSIKDVQQRED